MTYESEFLAHHGIPGQKWGIRRFQNEDGSYTPEGKERYGVKSESRTPGPQPHSYLKKKTDSKLEMIRTRSRRSAVTGGVYDRSDGTKDTKRLEKDAKKDAEDMARAKAYYGEGAGNRRKQIRNRISERIKDPDYKAAYEKHLAAQDMSKHQKAANRERHTEDAKKKAAQIGRGVKNIILGFGTTSIAAIALYNAAKFVGADKKIAEFSKKAFRDIVDKAKSMKKPSLKDFDWSKNRPTKYGNESVDHSSNASYRDMQKNIRQQLDQMYKDAAEGAKSSSNQGSSRTNRAEAIRKHQDRIKKQLKNGEWQNPEAAENALKNLDQMLKNLNGGSKSRIRKIK